MTKYCRSPDKTRVQPRETRAKASKGARCERIKIFSVGDVSIGALALRGAACFWPMMKLVVKDEISEVEQIFTPARASDACFWIGRTKGFSFTSKLSHINRFYFSHFSFNSLVMSEEQM